MASKVKPATDCAATVQKRRTGQDKGWHSRPAPEQTSGLRITRTTGRRTAVLRAGAVAAVTIGTVTGTAVSVGRGTSTGTAGFLALALTLSFSTTLALAVTLR